MGKGDVTMQFDAATAQAVSEILRFREQLIATGNTSRDVGQRVVQSTKEASDGFDQMSKSVKSSLGEIGAAAAVTGAAVGVILETLSAGLKQAEERTGQLIGRAQSLNEGLAASGQEKDIPQTRQALDDMARMNFVNRVFSNGEVTRNFVAVSGALSDKVSAKGKIDATYEALHAQDVGLGEAASQTVGINYANLARQRQPGETDKDLRDQAFSLAVSRNGAALDEKSLQFLARAKDKKQAVSMLLFAAHQHETPKGLIALQKAADEEITSDQLHEALKHPHNVEHERLLRLSKIPQADRMGAMMKDPSLAPSGDRESVLNLIQGAGNSPIRSMSSVPMDDSTRQLIDTENTASTTERINENFEQGAFKANRLSTLRRNALMRDHPLVNLMMGKVPLVGDSLKDLRMSEEERAYTQQPGAAPLTTDKSIQILERIESQLNSQTQHLQEINTKTSTNYPLDSNKPGAK